MARRFFALMLVLVVVITLLGSFVTLAVTDTAPWAVRALLGLLASLLTLLVILNAVADRR